MIILYIYLVVAGIVALITATGSIDSDQPKEIKNVWDWLIYSILWGVQPIKAFIRFIKNLVRS